MQAIEASRQRALSALTERSPTTAARLGEFPAVIRDSLAAVLGASDFVLGALARDETLISALADRADVLFAGAPMKLPEPDAASEQQFMTQLRRWRRAEFARIAWRDLAGWASLDETLGDLSQAAEAALRLAHEYALRALSERYGQPRSPTASLQQLIIVAMGKLGGRELNFSSDIDLVLLYPSSGETDGPRSISNEEFFTRLAQAMIRLLETPTIEGFVFRADLRLRPFGDSGPVVTNAAALEDYLQLHGRDWERYAWVKARPITNESGYDELFQQCIQPFVYRRYLDFGVFESLRDMKALIEREVQRRELADNIKLGDGGIREIEFIVQSFQLIRGGQDRRLQGTSLRQALARLEGSKLLPPSAVAELDAAYVFLRRLENRLQMHADQQLHRLPATEDGFEILAGAMGLASVAELRGEIERQRQRVAMHFHSVVFGGDARRSAEESPARALPLEEADREMLAVRLREMGYADGVAGARLLLDFRQLAYVRRLDAIGARRLTALLPVLVTEASGAPEPAVALRRLLRVIEAIGARSAYLALLLHNSRARQRLVRLASHGDFLVDQIASHPLLLDELIDERIFEVPPDRAGLSADLEQRMAGADQSDEEQLVERLRHFQRAAIFRLGVADLLARLPVMQVSDRLTDLAELIVERAIVLAWRQLRPQLGTPMCLDAGELRPVTICVIGYGKLGGMELSYSSDLDLVFLHDSSGARQETQGARVIDNQVFFVRFAQRLVHMLTMHSAAGRLYEVDMRLRPSGKGGLLITHIDAFAEYQRTEAWTWEHQALLHARSVAGAGSLRARFEQVRLDILAHHVRRDSLREDVRAMRNRMRNELSRAGAGEFDLKQDPGGIADIEFLAQYWALWWAQKYPPVALFSDTIRQLESVASADLVPQERIDVLTGIYRLYRTHLHHRALDDKGAIVPASEFESQRHAIITIWDEVMGA
ncbi:MAG TPA: bifunctional [glutamate--ammonia ligase]-adenylyl-L-tyrosine phosphorylase/[glutamate--ammonia-ligase] adenylyltransferase [Steroidobacteraceae bacterium]|nr:bifunctional [glutamate--ammonia ligase]-adenylyl-L-tyrosine phosphorylase/[glutamate--ammonia-ligase] adenylyltransferase [Steroidobacteraceae bacterium]